MQATIHFAIDTCSLGFILVAKSELGVCTISLGDNPDVLIEALEKKYTRASLVSDAKACQPLIREIAKFIENPTLGLQLPLDVRGTAFQQQVWQALCEIPLGSTACYTDIAKRIGKPTAARAVAQACAANPLALVIPCHRVIRQNGDLSGYRWGVGIKSALLKREAKGH